MKFQDFDKLRSSLYYYLLAANMHQALKAMHIGLELHTGKRKDGLPEFIHQISQVQYCRTLQPSLIYPEETFCTIFLHDAPEDHDMPLSDVRKGFGDLVCNAVELMTNRYEGGPKKDKEKYYNAMEFDPICSLTKGIDRLHNQQTMIGVFNDTKQISYSDEGEEHILPMMKRARKRWTKQEAAYQNVSTVLKMQMEWARYAVGRGDVNGLE